MRCGVFKFSLRFPHDAGALAQALKDRGISPADVLAVISKTDGNGELNDYSRLLAESEFGAYFADELGVPVDEVSRRITFIASSGSEGLAALHGYIIHAVEAPFGNPQNHKGLSVGVAHTRPLSPEEVGRVDQARLVSEATRLAMENAGITEAADVGVVFVKGPVLKIGDTYEGGRGPTVEPRSSIGLTRGASALGVALALSEVDERDMISEAIGHRFDLFSRKAFTFSGNEVAGCRVVLLGNSTSGNPDLFIASRSLSDLMDIGSVWSLLGLAGIEHPGQYPERLVALFAKFGAGRDGRLGGKRIAMPYSDLNVGRQLRAAASGMLVPLVGDPEVFVSGGAEHQGPPGGGLAAAIIRR